jgi:hypothetical protein
MTRDSSAHLHSMKGEGLGILSRLAAEVVEGIDNPSLGWSRQSTSLQPSHLTSAMSKSFKSGLCLTGSKAVTRQRISSGMDQLSETCARKAVVGRSGSRCVHTQDVEGCHTQGFFVQGVPTDEEERIPCSVCLSRLRLYSIATLCSSYGSRQRDARM